MNNKFYITFKTAKLLKEKGFNKAVDKLIHLNKYNIPIIESPENYYDETEVYNDYKYLKQNHYACPTKSEVIDWLESKGIVVVLCRVTPIYMGYAGEKEWSFDLELKESGKYDGCLRFPTRLKAEEAAIIKACELL